MQNKGTRKCKKCEDGIMSIRTRRSWLVKATLFWLPVKRYKCNACGRKRYIYGHNPIDKNLLKIHRPEVAPE